MQKKTKKVAIIGAGSVGSSAAFAMSLNQVASEVVLIDVAAEKARGEANDISHGLCFIGEMDVYSGGYECVKDCDVIVITAGANRKPGETRLDLAKKNVAIAKVITENIMQHYNGGTILVVANPVDILTYMISKWSGLPAGRVLGTGTTLDSARFRNLLAGKLDVDIKNVHGYIIGEHGDSQVPNWSNTHIAGIQIDSYCKLNGIKLTDEDKDEILEDIKTSGAGIIKDKGVTCYGIAVTISTLTETILKDSGTIRTVSSVVGAPYGNGDFAFSLPSVIDAQGVKKVLNIELSEKETELMHKSAQAIKAVLAEIGE